jgi:hypothetical protein
MTSRQRQRYGAALDSFIMAIGIVVAIAAILLAIGAARMLL